MATNIDRVANYCKSITSEFHARMNRLQLFVSHNVSTGTARESLLREFLLNHVPTKFDVGQGFVFDNDKGEASRQCDILIYNRSEFPLTYSDGPVKVVRADSANCVIEVKSNFDKKDTKEAFENIRSVRNLRRQINGLIFAFTSPAKLGTIKNNIKNEVEKVPLEYLPTAILLLDKDIVIHRWGLGLNRRDETKDNLPVYEVLQNKDSEVSIAMSFILLHIMAYLDSPFGEADSINTLRYLLKEYAKNEGDIF